MKYLPVLLALAFSLEARASAPSNVASNIASNLTSPSVVVYKQQRRLELYDGGTLVKAYRVGLGLDPVSPKAREGDRATPEGEYRTCAKNPKSTYAQALVLNYPNRSDAERGLKAGLISERQHAAIVSADEANTGPPFNTALGGLVEIHGKGSGADWTWGCIALDDADIAELYRALPVGTRVTIKP